MLSRSQYAQALRIVAGMDRAAIVALIRGSPAKFPIDFTDSWFESRSLEELRHVLAAICLHCEFVPATAVVNAGRAA